MTIIFILISIIMWWEFVELIKEVTYRFIIDVGQPDIFHCLNDKSVLFIKLLSSFLLGVRQYLLYKTLCAEISWEAEDTAWDSRYGYAPNAYNSAKLYWISDCAFELSNLFWSTLLPYWADSMNDLSERQRASSRVSTIPYLYLISAVLRYCDIGFILNNRAAFLYDIFC